MGTVVGGGRVWGAYQFPKLCPTDNVGAGGVPM